MAGIGPVDGTHGFAQRLWDMLAEGGVWGVPRSGLLFTRKGNTLVLTERMPYELAMPFTQMELHQFQQNDLVGIRDMFEAIGILVVDETVFA